MKLILTILLSCLCAYACADSWIKPARSAYTLDALQTWTIRTDHSRWTERTRLYAGMGNFEASAAVLAVNWGIERLITGIKDKGLRNVVGWLFAGYEGFVVVENASKGITVPVIRITF